MGVASLILGIISFLVSFSIFKDFSLICGVIALVLGIIAIVKKKSKGMGIAGVVLSIIGCIVLFGGTSSNPTTNIATAQNGNGTNSGTQTSTTNQKNNYTLGDSFEFDGFQITVGTEITYKTVNNQFSEHNGDQVIALPVTIVNNNSETKSLNMFYLEYFGSKGITLDNVDAYFDNTSITDVGKIRPGASASGYFYLLYDGNGIYGVDFDNFSQKFSLEFNVSK